jgi:hypothetical protein
MQPKDTEITITPDPQILQVLSYLEMKPQDSLCELIDNSLDALADAAPDSASIISIELPTRREVEEETAVVRVRDNGPGMTLKQVESALRAGYSSKPRHGALGLFGVGFNIATGKLGRTTKLLTAREEDDFAIQVEVDLINLRRSGKFQVLASQVPKPRGLEHGTIVEVSQPWGPNNQNHGFMLKLVGIGRPKLLGHLGRVYATTLRAKRVKIVLEGEQAIPFEHCVWSDVRYVEHAKWGKIHAVHRFNGKVIYSYVRCAECGVTVPNGDTSCPDPACGSGSVVTHQERLSGWVGIQRYGDSSHFGIDLIRNGRAIRLLEKAAFFEFEDPLTGDPVRDYPIDQNEGRIVGELHLDHVPVDPAKQNFERSSPEWRRAIEFVRGTSSLQPERPGADMNRSPVFMLYQGYRKVRGAGRRSMTMGKWEAGRNEAKPLSRDELEALKRRFENREPGYLDDAEWWRLVEQADQKPIPGLVKCKECHLESPEGSEECLHCGFIFEGKPCLSLDCGHIIQKSAVTCPHCGANQVPEIRSPWNCKVCRRINSADEVKCTVCDHPQGTPDPLSREGLQMVSALNEGLTIAALTVKLAFGSDSTPISVKVYACEKPLIKHDADGHNHRLPSVRLIDHDIEIYADPRHPLFQEAGVSLEEHVAFEVASYLYSYYQTLAQHPDHSISNLAYAILYKHWGSKFGTREVESELLELFASIRQKLEQSVGGESADVYANLSQDEQVALASDMVRRGHDLGELGRLKDNGKFVFFLRPQGILEIFRINPRLFFDGSVLKVTYSDVGAFQADGGAQLQAQIRREYGSLLEIAAVYHEKGVRDTREAAIAQAACRLLSDKLDL